MSDAERLTAKRPQAALQWVRSFAWSKNWPRRDCNTLWRWMYPCIINRRQYLVHHPQPKALDPSYYAALHSHTRKHGWQLMPYRRVSAIPDTRIKRQVCQRKPWAPIWLLACALSTAHAEPVDRQWTTFGQSSGDRPAAAARTAGTDGASGVGSQTSQQRIYQLLRERWQSGSTDPASLTDDLQQMAAYYSGFPEVRTLLSQLAQYDWQLRYTPKTYITRVSGTRLNIKSVSVFFDPRSAAQFKFYRACNDKVPFCVASPADVLLHELLHAHSILSSPEAFIAQGGMNTRMYPYEHERQTLYRERALYASMTAIDGTPRPLRNEHTGRQLVVACATCVR